MTKNESELVVETLEDRMMLSTVSIAAAGFEGTEQMQLLVDDAVVASFDVESGAASGNFQTFVYESVDAIEANQIKIAFVNDLYQPEAGLDRNLRIDFIEIDNERFETEDPSVFSNGTWRPDVGIISGYPQSEVLHSNGFFQFANQSIESTEVKVFAAGRIGDEIFSLEIDGVEVAVFDLAESGGQLGDLEARSFTEFTFQASGPVAPEDVRVNFLNDVFDPESGNLGRDVRIDKIEIDGVAYETEDPNVFSTGYAGPGFWEEEILEFNGYFQYAQQAVPDPTLMKMRASGTSGNEVFQLEIDDEVVAVYNLADYGVQPGDLYTGTFAQIIYQHTGAIDPAEIRITFLNDQIDPDSGIDYDLGIDNLKIAGITYQTESPSTFSTGTYVAGIGIVPGFQQSESMNANGYFQYLVDTSANNSPIALNDLYVTEIGTPVRGNVLDNDSDPDVLQLLKYFSHTGPSSGSVVFAANGNFTYTPSAGFEGSDTFSYIMTDANGGIATANVIIEVGDSTNLAPIANDDAFQLSSATSFSGNLLANDFDLDADDTISVQSFLNPSNGTVEVKSNGDFTYTPNAGFSGSDSFAYTIVDDNGGTASASVAFTVPEDEGATTVQVIASGTTGEEVMSLEINGTEIGAVQVEQTERAFTFELSDSVSPETDVFRIRFSNDLLIDGVVNRDLFVNKIIVNGVEYETESSTTYSTGTWQGSGTIGYASSEVLTNNGYFEYLASIEIAISASGDEGTEQIQLQIDEQTVATYDLSIETTQFVYDAKIGTTPDRVRILFEGDQYEPENGIDKNANVEFIEVDGLRIDSDDAVVFSTSTWTSEDGIQPGFARGTTLHTDGYFQYDFPAPTSDDFFQIPEDSIDVPLAIFTNDDQVLSDFEISTLPANGVAAIVNEEVLYTPNSEFVGVDSFFYRELGSAGDEIRVDVEVLPSHQQPQHLLNPAVASELTPSGKFLLIEKVVQLPKADNGRPARMNSMTTLGDRIFVVVDGSVQGEGKIFEIVTDENQVTSAVLFLDVGAAATNATGLKIDNSSPLNGLRSLSFHPDYETNGKLYVTYTGERPTGLIDTTYISDPENPVPVESVLAEFTFDFEANAVDAASYREVFRVGMRNSEHSIRQAIFNPFAMSGDEDYGLLYIGHGDGSEQSAVSGDGLNDDALGKILRIDPLASEAASYVVPAANPFIADANMIDEAFAIGFRNPHNLTFALDSNGIARLIVTEIGRDNIEEINVVESGKSYGWGDREGVFVHNPNSGTINGIDNLPQDEALNGYTFPNVIWGHEGVVGESFVGQAIAGGHVIQNGSAELDNQFVFLEFATDGRAYHVDFSEMLAQTTELDANESPSDLTWVTPKELTILFDHDNDDSTTPLVRSSLKDVLDDDPDFQTILSAGKVRADLRLGQGPNGELYILNKRNGWVYLATNTQ